MADIMHVTKYNRIQKNKWHEDCNRCKDYYNMPQLAFYCWFDKFGDYKKYGYVLKTDTGSRWAKTKKELLKHI